MDDELSYLLEEQYIAQLGYVPTYYIPNHEWEAELKRLELSNQLEKKNEPKA